MRVLDLKTRNVVIWGTGREGLAAAQFIHSFLPEKKLTFIDEAKIPYEPEAANPLDTVVGGAENIAAVLESAEVVVKSPGVSLYHPLLVTLKERGLVVTSLLNLWFAEAPRVKTIGVTGTKGKSTTTSLIAHMIKKSGVTCALLGNIGVPVTSINVRDVDYAVIEVSSYQAANFEGSCDIGVLTSLYPEHLDWHRSIESYYRDKLNFLKQAKVKIVNSETIAILANYGFKTDDLIETNTSETIHQREGILYNGDGMLGAIPNAYLARQHNCLNVCLALSVIKSLGLDLVEALASTLDFVPLPHRQTELGTKNGVLYVDDSISTAPQSTIVAIDVYRERGLTLIVGGHDRGVDYTPLVKCLGEKSIRGVICMGPSGERIMKDVATIKKSNVVFVNSMTEAVAEAEAITPEGGVILLSPAAPSFGLFRDFVERGEAFAEAAGFNNAQDKIAKTGTGP